MTPLQAKRKPAPTCVPEVRERGVRLHREHRSDGSDDNAAFRAIASKPGCSHDTRRACCPQAARHPAERAGLTTDERARFKDPERENRDLSRANAILKKGEPVTAVAHRGVIAPSPMAKADLPCPADRPGTLPSPCCHRAHARACLGTGRAGRSGPREDRGGPRQAPGAPWCPQGLASFGPCPRTGGGQALTDATGMTSHGAAWSRACVFKDYKGMCEARRRRPSPIQRSPAPTTRSTGSSWPPCPTSSGASHCSPLVQGQWRTISPVCRHGQFALHPPPHRTQASAPARRGPRLPAPQDREDVRSPEGLAARRPLP